MARTDCGARQGRRRWHRQRGPAQIAEVRANSQRLMFMLSSLTCNTLSHHLKTLHVMPGDLASNALRRTYGSA
eukprot:5330443-Pyramimonas_sp.AAC.1